MPNANYRTPLLLAPITALLLAACSSGGNIAIGKGQATTGSDADFAIAYIKRSIPTDPTGLAALRARDDLRSVRNHWTKADVYLRDRATPDGNETNITASVTGSAFWDAKDLDVSPDGTKLVFALRGPLTAMQMDRNPPSWHIWQYTVATQTLAQLTGGTTDLNPNANDVAPHFLTDGRIVFSSTRQITSKTVLTDEALAINTGPFEAQTEARNESDFVLHVMNADGSGLHQISFNPSHDLNATVLASGRLLWTRWDNTPGRTGGSAMHLYSANPDGTDVQLLYGAQSHDTQSTNPGGASTCPGGLICTVQFVQARAMQDGRVVAIVRPFTAADFGGNIEIIDVAGHVENDQAAPDSGFPSATVAEEAATQNDVRTQSVNGLAVPSPGGRFNSVFALWDGSNRMLASWTQCRLQDATGTIVACTTDNLNNANSATPTLTLAPPLYGAWLLDLGDGTLKPVMAAVEGQMVSDIVSLQPRTLPCTTNLTCPADAGVRSGFESYGILDIRSVYDRDGAAVGLGANANLTAVAGAPAARRPARFLRIEKAVSMGDPNLKDGFPNFDRTVALGGSVGYMRQLLGYTPVQPDGSVRVKVPANVALQITVVDANARALPGFPRHTSWLSVRPGEILSCNGCHQPTAAQGGLSGRSHGRANLFTALNAGAGPTFNLAGNNSVPVTVCTGDTMAQELAGTSCGSAPYNAADLSPNVSFADPWFSDAPFSLRYADLTTPQPIAPVCSATWSYFCRSVINYPTVIDPAAPVAGLWSLPRPPVGGVRTADGTCINCHKLGRVSGTAPLPPDGNLDLTDTGAAAGTQLPSYVQLVDTHTAFVLNPTTNTLVANGTVSGSIVPGSAASSRFFTALADATHAGFMTAAELRLLSEWVDIGAQYYNNPFDAPLAN
jgi:hypothetical protein